MELSRSFRNSVLKDLKMFETPVVSLFCIQHPKDKKKCINFNETNKKTWLHTD